MGEKYGYDTWDAETQSLSDNEIQDTINYADTICSIWGSSHQKMDAWEREHLKLIARHQLTWREYRPLHLKHVAHKNNIDVTDDMIDALFLA